MKRRSFLDSTLAGAALVGGMAAPVVAQAQSEKTAADVDFEKRLNFDDDLVVEHTAQGQPHKGKVLLHVMAHNDDHSGTGTAAKLINEGYTGYYVRFTNEDKSGAGSVGQGVSLLDDDTQAIAKAIGHTKAYDLAYCKHTSNEISEREVVQRLIFLYRLLQVDTIITFDPWSHYEENNDHYILGRCIEQARWHAGRVKDYPEQFMAGLIPKEPSTCYYHFRWSSGSRLHAQTMVNRVVDISSVIEKKADARVAGRWWGGPAGMDPEVRRQRDINRVSSVGERFGLKQVELFNYMNWPDR